MTRHTPIFKTLAPDEVYILHVTDGNVEYITNKDGEAIFKKTCGDK